jgi:hypothetical protein
MRENRLPVGNITRETVGAVVVPQAIAASAPAADSTTDMLLEIKNMTEKEIGMTYREVRVEEQVKRFCKAKLFHWLKFVVNKFDLGSLKSPHDIGNVVMKGLNVKQEEVKARWWLLYQGVVKKALDTQRSNCNMAIKPVMISECDVNVNVRPKRKLTIMYCLFFAIATEYMRANKMPSLDDILGGRRLAMQNGGEMNEAGKFPYFFFCNTILECVAGKKLWKVQKTKRLISKSCVTVSDEAFALLLMINSWEKFEYFAENPEVEDKMSVPATSYTEKKGRNKKMKGWSQEGLVKYNRLCECVVQDRQSAEGIQFEKDFLKYHTDEMVRTRMEEGGGEEQDGNGSDAEGGNVEHAYNHLAEMCDGGDEDDEDNELEQVDV